MLNITKHVSIKKYFNVLHLKPTLFIPNTVSTVNPGHFDGLAAAWSNLSRTDRLRNDFQNILYIYSYYIVAGQRFPVKLKKNNKYSNQMITTILIIIVNFIYTRI
jgi:hypothetical protein